MYLNLELNGAGYQGIWAVLRQKIDTLLGRDKPLHFENYGKNVIATSLEKSQKEKFLFFINWESEPVEVEAGIPLPSGAYQITIIDTDGEKQASINNNLSPTAKDLSLFSLSLEPKSIKVLYIQPKN